MLRFDAFSGRLRGMDKAEIEPIYDRSRDLKAYVDLKRAVVRMVR